MQDPCHLAHAQRITDAPRQVLRGIPGPTADRDGRVFAVLRVSGVLLADYNRRCRNGCSGARLATLLTLEPRSSFPPIPAASRSWNRGLRNAGAEVRVMHVVEIVDAAYQAEG